MDGVIGRIFLYFRTVGAALVYDLLGIDPLAVLKVCLIVELITIPYSPLGHAAAALFGIILRTVDKSLAAPFAKGLCQPDIEPGRYKGMYLFIESHNKALLSK